MRDHQGCVFCSIAAGQITAHIVYETDRIMAFLDTNPIRAGHTQIIPKDHFHYFDDLPADLLAEIMGTGQRVRQRDSVSPMCGPCQFLYFAEPMTQRASRR